MTVARDRCFAKRRDGQQCEATAIEFGTVCLMHGGGAPQVQMAAQRARLQFAIYCAIEDWQAVRGTEAAFELLCKVTAAERALERFEAKRIEVADMREAAVRYRAERGESHLPPWQPSAEDLAILGIRPKRRRPEGAQRHSAPRDQALNRAALGANDPPSAVEAQPVPEAPPAPAVEQRFVRPDAGPGPRTGRVKRPPWA